MMTADVLSESQSDPIEDEIPVCFFVIGFADISTTVVVLENPFFAFIRWQRCQVDAIAVMSVTEV